MTSNGIELLKSLEGWRNHPYLDKKGVPTIGFGNTYYLDGTPVTIQDPPITLKQGTELLMKIVNKFDTGVRSALKMHLTTDQYDALTCFAYNVGLSAFRTSTLLKVVNKDPQNYPEIERQMMRWVHVDGKFDKGLHSRRQQEFALYRG